MRKELFGDMSNWEIVGEVVGGLLFFPLLVALCYGILLVGQTLKAMDGHCLDPKTQNPRYGLDLLPRPIQGYIPQGYLSWSYPSSKKSLKIFLEIFFPAKKSLDKSSTMCYTCSVNT